MCATDRLPTTMLVLMICAASCRCRTPAPPVAEGDRASGSPVSRGEAEGRASEPNLRGGPEGIELANHQRGPEFVAVDDRFVYWTNFEDDGVFKVAKDGSGSPIEIARNDRGENKSIAVDDDAVYWGGTSLYRQPKSGGDIQRFSSSRVLVSNLIPVDGRIYWADGGRATVQLRSMSSRGGDLRALGPADKQDFIFAADARSVFIGRTDLDADDAGEIQVVAPDGGAPSIFARTRFLWKIVIDEHYVYWLEGRNTGTIQRKPRTGNGAAVTLTDGLAIVRPQSLAANGTSVYWTELGMGSGQGAVGKVRKAGGGARKIASHQVVPQAIAADDMFVYWVNFGPTNNGTVRKIVN
jgi:hypothetical protein